MFRKTEQENWSRVISSIKEPVEREKIPTDSHSVSTEDDMKKNQCSSDLVGIMLILVLL